MKDIDKELKDLAFDKEENFEKLIEKQINRRIKRISLKVVITILIILALIFGGISPILNATHVNAAKLNKGNPSQLLLTLRAYYETTYPYIEIFSVDVKKEGFGQYTLNIDALDHRRPIHVGKTNVVMKLERGNIEITRDNEDLMTVIGSRFDEAWGQSVAVEEIEKLPESAEISLSVKKDKPILVSDLLKKDGKEVQLQWFKVYGHKKDTFGGGVSLNLVGAWQESDMRQEISAGKLKEIYIKNLKTINENYDLLNSLSLPDVNSQYFFDNETLDVTIKEAKDMKKFETDSYCISGTKEEILAYLDKNQFTSVFIDDVLISRLAR